MRSAWKRSASPPWRAQAKEYRAFSSSPKFSWFRAIVPTLSSDRQRSPLSSVSAARENASSVEHERSKSRLGQQGRKRAAANIVDAGIGDAIAHDLDQHWSIELRAVELPQHHREVGARRIPSGFEIRAEFNLRRAVRAADRDLPATVGGLGLAAFRKPR